MHFLAELGEVVASNTQLQPILDWIVLKTTSLLAADEGCVRLVEAEPSRFDTYYRPRSHQVVSGSWPRAVATSVTGYLMTHEGPLVTPDLVADERFAGLRGLDTRVRALLAVPLKIESRMTGLIAVTQAAPGRRWTEDDVELLAIVGGRSAGAIEQARLRAEAEDKKRLEEEARRMHRELEQARAVQMRLVPSQPLRLGPWEISGSVTPAHEVGGDSFDYFMVAGRRLGFAIGDVSGKGMPAALFMMTGQSLLRAFFQEDRPLPEKMRLLNQRVTRSAEPGKFITMFYGELDPGDGTLRYINAGHDYPMLRRADGGIEPLSTGGLMLGFDEDVEFQQGETTMAPGDSLLLYSDGVTEALDTGGQDFGVDRVREVWRRLGGCCPGRCIEILTGEIQAFRTSAPPSDDLTLVVLSSAAPEPPAGA
jgi:serine phosphatase RsbU (regulator of sigma subunit)